MTDTIESLHTEIRLWQAKFAAEKERRERAEAAHKIALEGLSQVRAIADHNMARCDRLLAIEREARALVAAWGEPCGAIVAMDRLRAALVVK